MKRRAFILALPAVAVVAKAVPVETDFHKWGSYVILTDAQAKAFREEVLADMGLACARYEHEILCSMFPAQARSLRRAFEGGRNCV